MLTLFKNDLFDNDIYENYDCLGVEEFVEEAVVVFVPSTHKYMCRIGK